MVAKKTNNNPEKAINVDKEVFSFTSHIVAALRNSLIYGPSHSQVETSLLRAEETAEQTFLSIPELTFVCIEKDLLFSGKPMNKAGLHFVKLAGFMQSVGIQRLVFLPGVNAEEIRQFILDSTGMTEDGEETETVTIKSSAHIKVGRLVTGAGGSAGPRLSHSALINLMARGMLSDEDLAELKADGRQAPGEELEEIDSDLLTKAQEAIADICSGAVSRTMSIRDSAMSFIHYFLKYSESILDIAPLKEHDTLTFNHSVNVSILCAAQAKFLDVSAEVFRDIILAGLYYDFGKIRIPAKILNKVTPLTAREKKMIADHCLEGAKILSQNPAVPRVAVVAAYEHHMHYSGGSGYPKSERVTTPGIISQIVSIADFYDAALTEKPYRPAHDMNFVMDILNKRSGTQFNPCLVQNFTKVLKTFSV